MLLETLNALEQAGIQALKSTCGLDVTEREVSLVREGRQKFLTLGTLRIKGCALQMVHLGCDERLSGKLEGSGAGGDCCPGLDGLAQNFLTEKCDVGGDRLLLRGLCHDHTGEALA